MKKTFLDILGSIKKEGIDNLIKYLKDSSFFDDPASADSHNNYKGGLVEHSLTVYDNLKQYYPIEKYKEYEDSIKIIGLLHDVSLNDMFQKITKNIPLRGPDGKNKKRDDGRLVFVEKEVYDFIYDKIQPYPHGQASTYVLKRYIKLTKLEDLAIQWHHGPFDVSQNQMFVLNQAQKSHKLVLHTYFADREAQLYADKKAV